ncbi:MAG: Do family serine endopeptidase [Thermoanaerobaculia bacterium]
MSSQSSRRVVTVLLVFGAVVFGMVLAGGLNLTAPGASDPEPAPAQTATSSTPPPVASVGGLPGFADLADRVSPAVVSVEATTYERRAGRGRVDPFEFFFGPRRRERDPDEQEDEEFRSDSGGSGFIVSSDGYVVTNNHVIDDAEAVQVVIDGRNFEAEVKGTDPATDLALLKIDARELPVLPLGDSDRLRVGDWVMAIGSPQALTNTVTVGVVSAKQRRINISDATSSFENFIQTDAAINFGNSGGPLVNLQGEVVGINTAISFGSENIGFAVPVNVLKQVLSQLRDVGRVRRGYLGIGVNEITPEAADAFGLESTDGALVMEVRPGLPADRAGLRNGDIIVGADDRAIASTRELIDYVSGKGPDASVELEILRGGDRQKIRVKLAERPLEGEEPSADESGGEPGIEWLGIRYQDLTPGLRSMHGLPEDLEGVWITELSPRSPLYDEGLRAGQVINVITEVNGQPVDGVAAFERIAGEAPADSRLRIYVRRFFRGSERQPVYVFPAVP